MPILKITYLAILITTLTSCFEQPRDRRAVSSTRDQSNPYLNNRPSGSVALPGSGSSNEDGQEEDNGDTDLDSPNLDEIIPEEIKHCSWSADGKTGFENSSNSHLGAHTICQSQNSEVDVYLQLKNPISDAQICLIPTYSSGSSSIYIGEPRCLMVNDNKRIYKVTLLKNRQGYSSFDVTGVMAMKDKAFFYPPPFYQHVLSPDAYLFCSQFLDQYGDDSYCQSFKSVGQYVYKQF